MYHPAQDINHCVYRLLLIIESSIHERLGIDLYRFMDFYTLFPYLLRLITTFPVPINRFKGEFSKIQEPFESLKNTKRIFHELEQLQNIAIQNLLAKKILDDEAFKCGYLKRTNTALPDSFLFAIKDARLLKERWFTVLINEFPKANFNGKNGLKSRTGLMEYRYDMEKQ